MKRGTIEELGRRDAVREVRPVTTGFLGGEQMSIAWSAWPVNAEHQTPVDLVVEWVPDPAKDQSFHVEGRVFVDAVKAARAAQDPKAWDETIVEAAKLIVEDAATRDHRLRFAVSAKGGAA